ncbi:MAG TPA: hypothetical protein VJN18_12565 [Polyangiaceae bacterium]|nr:hypothetical protein [Polyangiaceae bacterium]
MPTNKLWIEHTERAAWDSVEALREKLSKAEERLQALLPNVDRVPQLLDLLQQAKLKHAESAPSHVEIVNRLLERLDSLQAELDAAKAPQPSVSGSLGPQPPSISFGAGDFRRRLDSDDLEDAPDSGRLANDQPDIADFTQIMRRRYESSGLELPRDVNRLLSLTETKLDDLAELEGSALREAAVDLAILAALIHEASRGKS